MNENLIESNPAIMMGKPVVAGTRITVESIMEKLASGETIEQILDAHPRLTKEAVHAAIAFAGKALRTTRFLPWYHVSFSIPRLLLVIFLQFTKNIIQDTLPGAHLIKTPLYSRYPHDIPSQRLARQASKMRSPRSRYLLDIAYPIP